MKPEMQWHKYEIVRKHVDLTSPPLQRRVAVLDKFGIEECGERVHFGESGRLLASLTNQAHVEVDDLVVQPVEALERVYVPACDRNAERTHKHFIWRRTHQGVFNSRQLLLFQLYSFSRKVGFYLVFILRK